MAIKISAPENGKIGFSDPKLVYNHILSACGRAPCPGGFGPGSRVRPHGRHVRHRQLLPAAKSRDAAAMKSGRRRVVAARSVLVLLGAMTMDGAAEWLRCGAPRGRARMSPARGGRCRCSVQRPPPRRLLLRLCREPHGNSTARLTAAARAARAMRPLATAAAATAWRDRVTSPTSTPGALLITRRRRQCRAAVPWCARGAPALVAGAPAPMVRGMGRESGGKGAYVSESPRLCDPRQPYLQRARIVGLGFVN